MKKLFSFLVAFSLAVLVLIGILYTVGVLPDPKESSIKTDTIVVYRYLHITELDNTGRYVFCRYCNNENLDWHLTYCLNPNKNKSLNEKK